jgi:Ca2+-binding EF-hand superfamily protein
MKNRLRHLAALVIVSTLSLAVQPAFAQNGDMLKQLEARFNAADKDHDGKLSKSEAEAGMPRLAKAFDKIDVDHTGYITLPQIEAFMAQMKKK